MKEKTFFFSSFGWVVSGSQRQRKTIEKRMTKKDEFFVRLCVHCAFDFVGYFLCRLVRFAIVCVIVWTNHLRLSQTFIFWLWDFCSFHRCSYLFRAWCVRTRELDAFVRYNLPSILKMRVCELEADRESQKMRSVDALNDNDDDCFEYNFRQCRSATRSRSDDRNENECPLQRRCNFFDDSKHS